MRCRGTMDAGRWTLDQWSVSVNIGWDEKHEIKDAVRRHEQEAPPPEDPPSSSVTPLSVTQTGTSL